MNYVNQGVLTGKFTSSNTVTVILKVNVLNENTKNGTDADAFTFYGLNESGEVVATVTLDEISAGENTVTLSGNGIVQVKVIMTDYPHNGTKFCNVNLGGLTVITSEGSGDAPSTSETPATSETPSTSEESSEILNPVKLDVTTNGNADISVTYSDATAYVSGTEVEQGTELVIDIKAKFGYEVSKILVNGSEFAGTTITLEDNTTLEVVVVGVKYTDESITDLGTVISEISSTAFSSNPYFVRGVVTSVTPNTKHGSYTTVITDGTNSFTVYSAYLNEGVNAPNVGDTVVAYGYSKQMYGTNELTGGDGYSYPLYLSVTQNTYSVTSEIVDGEGNTSDKATISGLSNSITSGTPVEFTVVANEGYSVSVKVEGGNVSVEGGTYSIEAYANIKVSVVVSEAVKGEVTYDIHSGLANGTVTLSNTGTSYTTQSTTIDDLTIECSYGCYNQRTGGGAWDQKEFVVASKGTEQTLTITSTSNITSVVLNLLSWNTDATKFTWSKVEYFDGTNWVELTGVTNSSSSVGVSAEFVVSTGDATFEAKSVRFTYSVSGTSNTRVGLLSVVVEKA